MKDIELIEEIRKGNNIAATILYEKYFEKFRYSPALSKLSDDFEKISIFNDAFLDSLKDFDGRYSFYTLLRRAIISLVINLYDYKRAKKRDISKTDFLSDNIGNSERTSLEEILESNEFQNPEEKAIFESELEESEEIIKHMKLSDKEKQMIRLRSQGYSLPEIADIVGMDHDKISKRLHLSHRKARKTKEIHNKVISFLYENGDNPIKGRYGSERKEYIKIILNELSFKLNVPITEIPAKFLFDNYIFPYNPSSKKGKKPLKKDEIINSVLPTHQKIPFFLFRQLNKWNNHAPKEAVKYLIMNHSYLYDSSLLKKLFWIPRLYAVKFDYNKDKFNDYIINRILRLTPEESIKYMILSEITDNDSTILPGTFNEPKEKAHAHISILEEIIYNTNLKDIERRILDRYLEGLDIEKLTSEFNISRKKAQDSIRKVINKLEITAIKEFRESYESGADIEKIKRETKTKLETSKGNTIFMNRYFRFNLQALIEWILERKGLELKDAPKDLTLKDPFIRVCYKYFGNWYDLFGFAFPGMFHRSQFNIKSKWDDVENIYDLFDKVMEEKRLFYVRTRDIPSSISRKYSILTLNSMYFNDRYRKKDKRFMEDDNLFHDYLRKRKLLSLVFNSEDKIGTSDDKISELNIDMVYKMSDFTPIDKKIWDYKLDNWNWDFSDHKNREISKVLSLPLNTVERRVRVTKKKLRETLEYFLAR